LGQPLCLYVLLPPVVATSTNLLTLAGNFSVATINLEVFILNALTRISHMTWVTCGAWGYRSQLQDHPQLHAKMLAAANQLAKPGNFALKSLNAQRKASAQCV
jgi:hypothetical protein